MSELEELISDVKTQGSFNTLEMEFIHTRTKGLMQLIQLLKVDEDNETGATTFKTEKLQELKETVSEIREEVTGEKEEKPEQYEEEVIEEVKSDVSDVVKKESPGKEPSEAETKKSEQPEPEEKAEVEQEQPEKIPEKKEEVKINIAEKEQPQEEDDEMLEEEAEKKDSRLGESFLKGKSVGDLVTDQNKLEFKLSNRPVSSIKTAIGINDRFQYIRELFDGKPEKFAETVNELDSKENVKQAVDYLRQNFRWKKSETSLKFVNLVKRRFQHG